MLSTGKEPHMSATKDLFQKAMEFYYQINEACKNSKNGKWYWEAFIPGPISYEDMRIITEIAGCWCYSLQDENIKFYTNQNHPNWLFM